MSYQSQQQSDRLTKKELNAVATHQRNNGKIIAVGTAPATMRVNNVYPFDITNFHDMLVGMVLAGHGSDPRTKEHKALRQADLERRAKLGSNLIPSISPLLTDTTPRLTKK